MYFNFLIKKHIKTFNHYVNNLNKGIELIN